jgi:hypothetical protein
MAVSFQTPAGLNAVADVTTDAPRTGIWRSASGG